MNQTGLAAELGVTQQAVSMWLKGVTKPSAERIERIEQLLGVPASDWLASDDEAASTSDIDVTQSDTDAA